VGPGDAAIGSCIRRDFELGLTPLPLLHREGVSLDKYAELVV
jgi:hypothetical protein